MDNPGAYLSVHALLLKGNASTRKELRDIVRFTQSGKCAERRYPHPVRIH
ncbi:hypothetical protein GCM10017673_45780 [Streptosporangium violaceochromogenes]|nr:hypothetical protein GCM10017673_45780 [Streptosporangium violaceochromogenes]